MARVDLSDRMVRCVITTERPIPAPLYADVIARLADEVSTAADKLAAALEEAER